MRLLLVSKSSGGGCMGLSGVTLAFLATFARMYPQRELGVMLMGIIPVRMQAQVALSCTVGVECSGFHVSGIGGNVAHSAHLGGLLFGMGYYEVWKKRANVETNTSRKVKAT